jgi:hypothetical protein
MGGAIFVHLGTVTITNSTLANNTARGGNTNTTGSAGGGSGYGGAIFNLNGTVTLQHATVAGNTVRAGDGDTDGQADGGSIYSIAYGNDIFTPNTPVAARVNVLHSILADSQFLDASGSTISSGVRELVNHRHSGATLGSVARLSFVGSTIKSIVEGGYRNIGGVVDYGGANVLTGDPQLDPAGLQNNGGPTPTIALQLGSPAIDQAVGSVSRDQRGYYRDSSADLGAVEYVSRPLVVAADAGHAPEVNVYNSNGLLRFSFLAYSLSYNGGVRVAVADVTGDGIEEILVAPGAGINAWVKVFDMGSGQLLGHFRPFGPNYRGGVFVAAGNFDADAAQEIVVGQQRGGVVRVFNADGTRLSGPLGNFRPFGVNYRAGVTVAAGNRDGIGLDEVIVGKWLNQSLVRVYGQSGTVLQVLANFEVYTNTRTGVMVAAGDLDGDGRAEIVTTPASGSSRVRSFPASSSGTPLDFPAYPVNSNGARVALWDWDRDNQIDWIIVGAATDQDVHKVRRFKVLGELNEEFVAFVDGFTGGVFVG